MPVLLSKFKEKRITDDILQALEHLMGCIELGEIIESLGAVKTEKAPHAKVGIAKFIENAIRTEQGLFRIIRDRLEARYKRKIPRDHPALPWMVEHALQ